ncbi:MAG: MFS transporter [Gemmatimonadaceae bacterium]|nr:MFS transporter [Gemmatimonadaceae bacterium]NUQ92831.1 MFS transporter [Gemmatimonadaceae bacterium]NUR33538.1 MFS transporter [Gemmatimonadaceae bacterium]NUS96168.1 MFS transporter [Gemmatimonadaceae bacterium]
MHARHDPYVSLRIPNFRWYVASLVAFTLGTQIQAVVVAWQVYELTKDPLSLGLVGLAEALPFISAALYAGHIADRHNRKQLAVTAMAVQTLCALTLLTYTVRPHLVELGRVWPIYAVMLVSGLARSFQQPARTALGAEIVPRETYANAVAWRSSLWQFAAVIGPALGGMLYGFSGARMSYLAEAVLCGIGAVLFGRILYTRRPAVAHDNTGIAENLTVGIRFLLKQKELLGAQVLDLFSVLFGGAPALLPIFTSEILKVGPQGLGILRAAPAAGAVVMSVVLTHRRLRNAGRMLFLAVAGFGLCWIFFALSRSFWLSLVLLALSGMLDNVSVVIRSTLLTIRTPEHLLGRVSAVNQIFIGSSNEIGEFESGVAARLLGAVRSVVVGGVLTLGVVGVTAWRVPALRELDELA